MNRILLAFLAVLIALVVGQFALSRVRAAQFELQRTKLVHMEAAFKASQGARERSDRALALLTRDRALAASAGASAASSLTAAKRAEPTWAAAAVPEGVRSAFK